MLNSIHDFQAKASIVNYNKCPIFLDLPITELEGGTCNSTGWNKRCLRKDEIGSFADFMQAGDPCFLNSKGKRVSADKPSYQQLYYNVLWSS